MRIERKGLFKQCFWSVVTLILSGLATSAAAQVSTGTAFSVAPGLLITNHHVIEGCGSVDIISPDGRRSGAIVDADDRFTGADILLTTCLTGAKRREVEIPGPLEEYLSRTTSRAAYKNAMNANQPPDPS